MKICLLTRRFALETGGIGRVSVELRNRLRALGHEVYTVSTDKEDLVSYFKYAFWDIRSKIPQDCDVYHAITPMESIWLPKDKSIATVLDIIPVTHPERHGARMGGHGLKSAIGKACFTIGCRSAAKCRHIVCISDHVKQEFIKHIGVPRGEISVIKLGIRDDLEPMPRRDNVFRIGYLGQLDKRKRVDLLIKAFRDSGIKGELVLGGKGFDEAELRAMAEGDDRIKFMGFVPDAMLPNFYNNLDYLVFPTAIEGYALPIIEAMACEKPVIVLDDSIIPNEVKVGCIMTSNLAAALLPGVKVSKRWLNNNYKFAKEHNWDKTVASYLALYEEIVAYPKPKGRITKAVDQLTDAGLTEHLEDSNKL